MTNRPDEDEDDETAQMWIPPQVEEPPLSDAATRRITEELEMANMMASATNTNQTVRIPDPPGPPEPTEQPVPVVEQPPTEGTKRDTYRVVTEQMTRRDAAASRRPGLRPRKCVVKLTRYLPSTIYAIEEGGIVDSIENAKMWTVDQAIAGFSNDDIIELLDEEILAKQPKVRSFDMEHYLDDRIIPLLKNSPENPMVRAILQSKFGRKPPAEINTYDAIKEWIEFNCDKPPAALRMFTPPPPPPPRPPQAFTVEMTREYTEVGRCTYKQDRKDICKIPFDETEIDSLIRDGLMADELVENIQDQCYESGSEYSVDTVDAGDETHSDYDSDGESDSDNNTEIQTNITEALKLYVLRKHGQGVWDRMN